MRIKSFVIAIKVLSSCPLLTDGEPIANTTLIDSLLDKDFQLIVNDAVYNVCAPEKGTTHFSPVVIGLRAAVFTFTQQWSFPLGTAQVTFSSSSTFLSAVSCSAGR